MGKPASTFSKLVDKLQRHYGLMEQAAQNISAYLMPSSVRLSTGRASAALFSRTTIGLCTAQDTQP
jgi:hypothetical protein